MRRNQTGEGLPLDHENRGSPRTAAHQGLSAGAGKCLNLIRSNPPFRQTRRFRAIGCCAIRKQPTLRSMAIWGVLKRIKHRRAQASDVAIVARHQRQAVDRRGRREQPIDNGNRPDGAHTTPLIGYGVVDPEHASIECGLDFPQPSFKHSINPPVICKRFCNCGTSGLSPQERAELVAERVRLAENKVSAQVAQKPKAVARKVASAPRADTCFCN